MALLAGVLLAMAPARVHQGRAQRAETPPAGTLPADPAPAPPDPANLSPRPGLAQPAQAAPAARPFTLPPGMEALPGGAWRLRFPEGKDAPPRAADAALAELGRRLAAGPEGRVVLFAQASGPADASTARRVSLARGLAVKDALVAGGLPATRIDIRPMGRTEEAADAVDVQPPGHPPAPPGDPRPVTDPRSTDPRSIDPRSPGR
jgi:outer membrane protein OmpA-like peptidoglycan-associated protein